MYQVRMYTVYTDAPVLPDDATVNALSAAKVVQGRRDQTVLGKMQRLQVPSFPMFSDEFVKHMSKFKALTLDVPTLCLLFELPGTSEDKVLVVKGAICTTFCSLEDAAHWCVTASASDTSTSKSKTQLSLNKVPAV